MTAGAQPALVATMPAMDLSPPGGITRKQVRARLLLAAAVVGVAVGVIVLLPGAQGLRSRFSHASPGWLAVGAGLKLLSGFSYVVIFRAVFCRRMSWRVSAQIGMAELGANAVLPTGGAGGLALGAWALRRGGMSGRRVARRSVAFFLLTSVANVVSLILVGIGLAVGILPGHVGLALTLIPAAVAVLGIVAALLGRRLAARLERRIEVRHGGMSSRLSRAFATLAEGIEESVVLLREHDWRLIAGSVGYLSFDVMVLWATFRAFGPSPDLAIVWIAYLIGELGGLIPVPGGIGGVDAGLVGTLVVYGTSVSAATAAVLAYRAVALWVPAVFGGAGFLALRRTLRKESDQIAVCVPGTEMEVLGLGRVVIERPTQSGG